MQEIDAATTFSVFPDFLCSVGLNQNLFPNWWTYLTGNSPEDYLVTVSVQVMKAGTYLLFGNLAVLREVARLTTLSKFRVWLRFTKIPPTDSATESRGCV